MSIGVFSGECGGTVGSSKCSIWWIAGSESLAEGHPPLLRKKRVLSQSCNPRRHRLMKHNAFDQVRWICVDTSKPRVGQVMIRLWYLPRLLDICGCRVLAALPTTDLGKLQHFLDLLWSPPSKELPQKTDILVIRILVFSRIYEFITYILNLFSNCMYTICYCTYFSQYTQSAPLLPHTHTVTLNCVFIAMEEVRLPRLSPPCLSQFVEEPGQHLP